MGRAILAIAACTVACAHALEPLKPAIKPWQRATPNALTAARLAAAPVVAAALATPGGAPNVAAGAFAVASVSDGLDGYLARRWRCESALGAFLDPVADKVLVSATLVMLSARFGVDVAVPAAVIVCREVGVSALREWMAARGARDAVAVGFSGKLKTACQMAALFLLTWARPPSLAYRSGVALLDLSALLAVYSGAVLARRGARALGSPAAAPAAGRVAPTVGRALEAVKANALDPVAPVVAPPVKKASALSFFRRQRKSVEAELEAEAAVAALPTMAPRVEQAARDAAWLAATGTSLKGLNSVVPPLGRRVAVALDGKVVDKPAIVVPPLGK